MEDVTRKPQKLWAVRTRRESLKVNNDGDGLVWYCTETRSVLIPKTGSRGKSLGWNLVGEIWSVKVGRGGGGKKKPHKERSLT